MTATEMKRSEIEGGDSIFWFLNSFYWLNLHRNNPSHEEVYKILEKAENKNAYIREAIIFYHTHKNHLFWSDEEMVENIRKLIASENEKLIAEMEKDKPKVKLTRFDDIMGLR